MNPNHETSAALISTKARLRLSARRTSHSADQGGMSKSKTREQCPQLPPRPGPPPPPLPTSTRALLWASRLLLRRPLHWDGAFGSLSFGYYLFGHSDRGWLRSWIPCVSVLIMFSYFAVFAQSPGSLMTIFSLPRGDVLYTWIATTVWSTFALVSIAFCIFPYDLYEKRRDNDGRGCGGKGEYVGTGHLPHCLAQRCFFFVAGMRATPVGSLVLRLVGFMSCPANEAELMRGRWRACAMNSTVVGPSLFGKQMKKFGSV
ncbi:hypothetical protein BKA80DRAFT_223910, partial [Phyllosticta citrichinensis]